ncbi:hypothetical protein ABXZ88_003278 [Vibrio fluvialis]|uniref:hypothetical protein n=1 Tax=Vibrio fluvialis TaxID=676 RepID=UPI0023A933BC|nr:hypothetical protein [Vibrio fluvialis]MDE5179108.1 hypothetical protein [Vibrio fluvialis]
MMMVAVDSRTQHDEMDTEFLMILAGLNPSDGFERVDQNSEGTPIVVDKNGDTGELHSSDYHIETRV